MVMRAWPRIPTLYQSPTDGTRCQSLGDRTDPASAQRPGIRRQRGRVPPGPLRITATARQQQGARASGPKNQQCSGDARRPLDRASSIDVDARLTPLDPPCKPAAPPNRVAPCCGRRQAAARSHCARAIAPPTPGRTSATATQDSSADAGACDHLPMNAIAGVATVARAQRPDLAVVDVDGVGLSGCRMVEVGGAGQVLRERPASSAARLAIHSSSLATACQRVPRRCPLRRTRPSASMPRSSGKT